MANDPSLDRAYLIRCWREGDATSPGAARWRFSVEEVLYRRKRQGFQDLPSLVAFLRAELGDELDWPTFARSWAGGDK